MFKKTGDQNIKFLKFGMTTVELLFGVAFVVLMGVAVSSLQDNIFSSSRFLEDSFGAEGEVRVVLRNIVSELRSLNYSAVGSYPIGGAFENSLIFYSDINGDGNAERLRYFRDGDLLKVGVVYPSGSPLSYLLTDERVKVLVRNISNTPNIFSYYDTNYNGQSSPLAFPVNTPLIRMVKVSVPIMIKNRSTITPYVISSQVSLRNLKENL